jgi:hypothetical protein
MECPEHEGLATANDEEESFLQPEPLLEAK